MEEDKENQETATMNIILGQQRKTSFGSQLLIRFAKVLWCAESEMNMVVVCHTFVSSLLSKMPLLSTSAIRNAKRHKCSKLALVARSTKKKKKKRRVTRKRRDGFKM